jgi:hypothetical protein
VARLGCSVPTTCRMRKKREKWPEEQTLKPKVNQASFWELLDMDPARILYRRARSGLSRLTPSLRYQETHVLAARGGGMGIPLAANRSVGIATHASSLRSKPRAEAAARSSAQVPTRMMSP